MAGSSVGVTLHCRFSPHLASLVALGGGTFLPEEQNLGLLVGDGDPLALGVFSLESVNQEVGLVL